jgi:flagellar protein FliO/FliZ
MEAGSWFQSFFALAFVLALVWGAAWFARRSGLARPAPAAILKTVASVSVGARERVAVIEVGDTWMVVGVAPGNVRSLHVMPRGEQPTVPAQPFVKPDFAALLKRFQK